LVETRRAMNISSPGEFMQAVPGVTDELHVALTSANTELVGAGSRAQLAVKLAVKKTPKWSFGVVSNTWPRSPGDRAAVS
jgi:hypothetical protein